MRIRLLVVAITCTLFLLLFYSFITTETGYPPRVTDFYSHSIFTIDTAISNAKKNDTEVEENPTRPLELKPRPSIWNIHSKDSTKMVMNVTQVASDMKSNDGSHINTMVPPNSDGGKNMYDREMLVDSTKHFELLLEKSGKHNKNAPLRTLITAIGRSGSSFLGDLFNNHKDVMYFFEPMHSAYLVYEHEDKSFLEDKDQLNNSTAEYFKDLLSCNVRQQHVKLLTHFSKLEDRFRAIQLAKPPFCHQNESRKCRKEIIRPRDLMQVCNKRITHTVIKELQPRMPNHLQGLLGQLVDPVKVIILVRDPRAIFQSWENVNWFKERHSYEEIEESCTNFMINVKYAQAHLKPLGLLQIIRYEDICMNFPAKTSEMFEFVDLKVYPEYQRYLNRLQEVKYIPRRYAYDTQRPLKQQVNRWRRMIKIKFVETIEAKCWPLMNYFNYRLVRNDPKLLRNMKIPLY